jgi:hypothetical protein
MYRGWSVNLTSSAEYTGQIALPVPPLFETTQGPVVELVFWSQNIHRWVHIVSAFFQRDLPAGHVQMTAGDIAWLSAVVARAGEAGLRQCLSELEECMVPGE